MMSLAQTPYLAALILILGSIAAFWRTGVRPAGLPVIAQSSALAALAVSLVAALFFGLNGASTSAVIGQETIGFSARLDSVSVPMGILVTFIGWIVIRYANTYLDGEGGQGALTGKMLLTLAVVLLLVYAGNLVQLGFAWVAMGIYLRQMLLFYPDRIEARRAVRKMTLVAIISDTALIAGLAIIGIAAGTTDIDAIGKAVAAGSIDTQTLTIAASLIGLAAFAKSAQFPFHGWLTEVMETPTPVSALLHAGIINAGGFLLIRFADLMIASPWVLAALALAGGFAALFASTVMPTQPAVKTALACSTVAQMGFMILQCGLGLFALALLHIIAHSLYKAHAFLSSGGAIERISAERRPGPVAIPDGWAVARAFALALAIYGILLVLFGFDEKPVQAAVMGMILIFGIAYLIAQGLADAAPRALTMRTTILSIAASLAYFAFQAAAEWWAAGTLPSPREPGLLEWGVLVLAVASFGAVAFAQATLPRWKTHPAARALRVHLANGLYVNAVFNRLTGAWAMR